MKYIIDKGRITLGSLVDTHGINIVDTYKEAWDNPGEKVYLKGHKKAYMRRGDTMICTYMLLHLELNDEELQYEVIKPKW